MKKILILLLLGGCANAEPVHTPSGKIGHMVNCQSLDPTATRSACYKKAGELCGKAGYKIIDSHTGRGSNDLTVISGNMMIECNGAL